MKLVTFVPSDGSAERPGWLHGEWVVSAPDAQRWAQAMGHPPVRCEMGPTMMNLLIAGPEAIAQICAALGEQRPAGVVWRLADVRLCAPLPRPRTVRDFYAFEAHVKTARARRGLEMVPEWYQFPVFYFSNPNAILGPDDLVERPRETQELDFELEVAAVICKEGRNIPAEQAAHYVGGYMIMNDWSARDIQRAEMKVGLGPAKGKDFASSFGPWLVTPDELQDRQQGAHYRLEMVAQINGREVARGNLADLHFTFAQMIERASRDCTLYPGEVIGSGTVGTGCLLETGAAPWLLPGDRVDLQVERLGILSNTVR